MAILIPASTSCNFETSGERRLADRLAQKLDDDYLLWYNVPVGPRQSHPDFVVLHPQRGLLILETKDWYLETIRAVTRQACDLIVNGHTVVVKNPLAQARHCATELVDALQRDRQLVQADGPHQGKLSFPWSYGVVFTRITRQQFNAAGLGDAIAPHHVICKDEMLEHTDPEAFQQRLWAMFPHAFGDRLTPEQLDRVRWTMFPQVRVQTQGALFDDNDPEAEVPDFMQVMDLQQEQLARSLGDGHRVIHGVAGSGKTMILGYRAEYLARAFQAGTNIDTAPILILCYNEPLAVKLESVMAARGLADKVQVRHFHKWCRQQLVNHDQPVPAYGPRMFEEMVANVLAAVAAGTIPTGQYRAILVDEGHDFAPEWLTLATQMVDPATNSLLLLYDDAQSIYERARGQQFSFKSVGVQAQGRTTILKINYRNTRQILHAASLIAADLLTAEDKDDDGIPLLKPISCGRDGPVPLILRLPTRRAEAEKIAELLAAAHEEGHAWGDMAILCRHHSVMDECSAALTFKQLPHQIRRTAGDFKPDVNKIKVMTLHASKGLEFAVVALAGVGDMGNQNAAEREEARLFYVGATRATTRLLMTMSGTPKTPVSELAL